MFVSADHDTAINRYSRLSKKKDNDKVRHVAPAALLLVDELLKTPQKNYETMSFLTVLDYKNSEISLVCSSCGLRPWRTSTPPARNSTRP